MKFCAPKFTEPVEAISMTSKDTPAGEAAISKTSSIWNI